MNSLTWTFVIGCTVLLFTAQRADGIRCYSCVGSGCGDEFKPAGVKIEENCSGSCSKLKGGFVTRSCSFIELPEDCTEEGDAAICHCSTDLCNGSTTAVASSLVMGVFTAVALMLKKF